LIATLRQLFDTLLAGPGAASTRALHPAAADPEHWLQLATAVLLVEVMRADSSLGEAERASVLAALNRKFTLTPDESARLLELAEGTAQQATDLHAFTSALNDRLSFEEKVRVVEAMWGVAYADGELAAHEQHVLWRLSDLLHVPHGAYINAKIRAKAAAGL
jgi:uncharacterized tellurite resistance protein B-like protein